MGAATAGPPPVQSATPDLLAGSQRGILHLEAENPPEAGQAAGLLRGRGGCPAPLGFGGAPVGFCLVALPSGLPPLPLPGSRCAPKAEPDCKACKPAAASLHLPGCFSSGARETSLKKSPSGPRRDATGVPTLRGRRSPTRASAGLRAPRSPSPAASPQPARAAQLQP